MKSRIVYSQNLPDSSQFSDETVLFYDSILTQNTILKKWIESYPYKIALNSGEQLKTLESFGEVLNKISNLKVAKSTNLTFVALGGGSIGDFVGFVASVYLRGRRLVLIPSTWLAAVDSSHGGKTGLNFLKTKNQIGSFYPAEKIYIVNRLLLTQPAERLQDSLGEILKMVVLADKKLFAQLESKITSAAVLKMLPRLIDLKYQVVSKDPFEKNGHRRLLNLGHTMGHVFESHYGWPHGLCVMLGLQFAARWSFHNKFIRLPDFFRISMLIDSFDLKQDLSNALKGLSKAQIQKLLARDKKITSQSSLDFIFINKIGSCSRKSVTIQQILNEVERQKLEY